MKKKMVLGGLVLAAALMLAPAVTAEAKEVKAGESIPLTAEYFPDEWFLTKAKTYDKNTDGALSPEEIAAVTKISSTETILDFSQLQYFTNLRELELGTKQERAYISGELDFTVFSNLEKLVLYRRGPEIEIKVSGLTHLKELVISDDTSGINEDINIGVIDLRNMPELENVDIQPAKDVIFDDVTKIRQLRLYGAVIKENSFSGFPLLESVDINGVLTAVTCADFSECRQLVSLSFSNDYLEKIVLPETTTLKEINIESRLLDNIDVSRYQNLSKLSLICPAMKALDVDQNVKLTDLSVSSEQMTAINVSNNTKLARLEIKGKGLKSLDVRKNVKLVNLCVESTKLKQLNLSANTKLRELNISNTAVKSIDLSKQKALKKLSLVGNEKLTSVNLSANTELTDLELSLSGIKSIDLTKLKKLKILNLGGNKKLTKLDLTKNVKLTRLELIGNSKLTNLNLTKNTKLKYINVGYNALKSLTIGSKPYLTYLDCSYNKLTKIDLSGVDAKLLKKIYCDKGVTVKGYTGKVKYY